MLVTSDHRSEGWDGWRAHGLCDVAQNLHPLGLMVTVPSSASRRTSTLSSSAELKAVRKPASSRCVISSRSRTLVAGSFSSASMRTPATHGASELVGIDTDTDVDVVRQLELILLDRSHPVIPATVDRVLLDNGRQVVAVVISPSPVAPHAVIEGARFPVGSAAGRRLRPSVRRTTAASLARRAFSRITTIWPTPRVPAGAHRTGTHNVRPRAAETRTERRFASRAPGGRPGCAISTKTVSLAALDVGTATDRDRRYGP